MDDAEAAAKSFGYGNLAYNTGSGMINLLSGSGIAQFGQGATVVPSFNSGSGPQVVPLESLLPDKNYGVGSDIVTIFSPGMYLVTYSVVLRRAAGNRDRFRRGPAR